MGPIEIEIEIHNDGNCEKAQVSNAFSFFLS